MKFIIISFIAFTIAAAQVEPIFSLKGDFDQQINQLLTNIRISKDDILTYLNITNDVKDVLRERWPDCEIGVMGSIGTGLAFKRSDLDMCAMIPGPVNIFDQNLVVEARNLLENRPNLFKDFEKRKQPRVPVFSFVHVPTGVSCDLNINGVDGVKNAELFNHLMHTDERALNLTLAVKYWAKLNKLVGNRSRGNIATNSYATVLLVIFYLQQEQILPPIELLQRNAPVYMLNGWNYGFDCSQYSSNANISLYQLLGGFFKYYKYFDYDKYVISPYLGRPIERESFLNLESLPKAFDLYKHNIEHRLKEPLDQKAVIQNPFEHDQNAGWDKDGKFSLKFADKLSSALSAFELNSDEDFLRNLLQPNDTKK